MPKRRHRDPAAALPGISSQRKTLSFDIIKSNLFRSIHADGVWGGITPQGAFAFTFYNERFPIPQQITHEISPAGHVGNELPDARVTRKGIVREADICIYMNLNLAKSFRKLLDDQIGIMETAEKRVEQKK
jgi:hypothetical protein